LIETPDTRTAIGLGSVAAIDFLTILALLSYLVQT
jgi:hypothetical protein